MDYWKDLLKILAIVVHLLISLLYKRVIVNMYLFMTLLYCQG